MTDFNILRKRYSDVLCGRGYNGKKTADCILQSDERTEQRLVQLGGRIEKAITSNEPGVINATLKGILDISISFSQNNSQFYHNKNIKNQAQRMAVNSVIQGTAAEILKKVMIEVYRYIKDKEGISLLLQVHDELIFEVHKDKVDLYKNEIEKIMKNTVKFDDVPLEINTNIGINWAETK